MNGTRKLGLILGCIIVLQTACTQQTSSPLWNDLTPGLHDVGFRTVFAFDDSRALMPTDSSSKAFIGRPVRIMVWYPGVRKPWTKTLSFSDYIDVQPSDERFKTYNEMQRTRDLQVTQRQFFPRSDSLVSILMATSTAACRDIKPAKGPFPLILYATGIGDFQQESTVLWEYLASHGYIVAVVPQFGPDINHFNLPYSLEGLSLQVQDAAFALSKLVHLPYVDEDRIGTIGHSYGGLVAWQLASINSNIKVMVSLDGSINRKNGHEVLRAAAWDAATMRIPVLNMYTLNQGERDLSIVDAASHAHRYHVVLKNASHYDFQNWALYAALTHTTDSRTESLRSSETGRDIYLSIVRLTRAFLDGWLKNDTATLAYVSGESYPPYIPEGLVEFRFQPGSDAQ